MQTLDQVVECLSVETGVNLRSCKFATLFHSRNIDQVGDFIDSVKPDRMSELSLQSGEIERGLSFEYGLPLIKEAVRFIEVESIRSTFLILHEADVGVQFSNEAGSILKFLSNDQESYQKYCENLDFTKTGWNRQTAEVRRDFANWCRFVDEWKNLPKR